METLSETVSRYPFPQLDATLHFAYLSEQLPRSHIFNVQYFYTVATIAINAKIGILSN